jgi:two-component system, NarL family, invasion response regulator UvrY
MIKKGKIQVAIVDDHAMMSKALVKFISSFEDYSVLFEAANGREMGTQLQKHGIPDIVLLDINMPIMDGYETANWLRRHYPQIKVLSLSMNSDESSVIRMLRLGAKGYITKNAEPEELKLALDSVYKKNFYLSDYISGKVISGLNKDVDKVEEPIVLTDKEKEFLQLICTELSYRDIAAQMGISPRTVEDHRHSLFDKMNVKTRVGVVLYAIKHELVVI